MDTYEKMRKMNELAKDLKQHGFADSSFEAIKQASEIYGEDELSHNVKHGLINGPQDRITGEEKMSETDNDRKLKKMQDDINTLTEKLNEIIKAINDIDARMMQFKNKIEKQQFAERPVEVPVERKIEKPVEAEKPAAVEHEHAEHKSGEYENQRVGNYQSQDVAIDKMFYFGKK
ncbi:TPA: hypothetical protein HA235_07550 [Candidatus Woesearchaeota archaeon]|nr:hypothetical protein [Candidatus Woesearchaeota archaeon]HIH32533.1 hypothetical protein [Candidatus Woesearchaeota archaeon]HIH55091.1 hypothetical protein [Candidatus Woesearchaeota archaeon]HIJ01716.1 hypothetical protein [Candidatus Woesearchaeota archaeon]HIJ13244.1 hypothetical protein [Candidatus Woesearchaeota archaeon]